ncbi:MAG: hypothetical protein LBJ79_03710 [Endomicrobium sp.]|jgi:hypothetical protein|nr:hypothetical protein [Endomicrobium sp.]
MRGREVVIDRKVTQENIYGGRVEGNGTATSNVVRINNASVKNVIGGVVNVGDTSTVVSSNIVRIIGEREGVEGMVKVG